MVAYLSVRTGAIEADSVLRLCQVWTKLGPMHTLARFCTRTIEALLRDSLTAIEYPFYLYRYKLLLLIR